MNRRFRLRRKDAERRDDWVSRHHTMNDNNCPICGEAMTPIYDPDEKCWIDVCPVCGIEVKQEAA